MLELDGITIVRRPDGSRWSDGALFRFSVRLVDGESGYEFVEETTIEEIQSYPRFQCFVGREFGQYYRYTPAENPAAGQLAWSDLVAACWGREPQQAAPEPAAPVQEGYGFPGIGGE